MKPSEFELQITDYLLGEMSAKECQEFEQKLHGNHALRMAFDEAKASFAQVFDCFQSEEKKLHPWQYRRILNEAQNVAQEEKIVPFETFKQTKRSWGKKVAVIAASAIIGGFAINLVFEPMKDNTERGVTISSYSDFPEFSQNIEVSEELALLETLKNEARSVHHKELEPLLQRRINTLLADGVATSSVGWLEGRIIVNDQLKRSFSQDTKILQFIDASAGDEIVQTTDQKQQAKVDVLSLGLSLWQRLGETENPRSNRESLHIGVLSFSNRKSDLSRADQQLLEIVDQSLKQLAAD